MEILTLVLSIVSLIVSIIVYLKVRKTASPIINLLYPNGTVRGFIQDGKFTDLNK